MLAPNQFLKTVSLKDYIIIFTTSTLSILSLPKCYKHAVSKLKYPKTDGKSTNLLYTF